MHDKLFEAALALARPRYWAAVEFDEAAKVPSIPNDVEPDVRFAAQGAARQHSVHDTVTKTFQRQCRLPLRAPRVKYPDGSVQRVKLRFSGRLAGFSRSCSRC